MKRIVVGSFIIALAAALMVPGTPWPRINTRPNRSTASYRPLPEWLHRPDGRAIEKVWPKYSLPAAGCRSTSPGAPGSWATEFVVRSKPDGYTFYFGYGSGHDIVMPHLQKMPYDPYKDLIAVARISVHSVVVVTGAKSEFNSLPDMIAWSKKENKPITSSVSTKAGAQDITHHGA